MTHKTPMVMLDDGTWRVANAGERAMGWVYQPTLNTPCPVCGVTDCVGCLPPSAEHPFGCGPIVPASLTINIPAETRAKIDELKARFMRAFCSDIFDKWMHLHGRQTIMAAERAAIADLMPQPDVVTDRRIG